MPSMAARVSGSSANPKKAAWLRDTIDATGAVAAADLAARPWSAKQPLVVHEHAAALADLLRARAACGRGDAATAAWFTAQVGRPRTEIDPPPLVTGADLLAAGVVEGPALGAALARVRALQLDGVVATREQALAAALHG